MGCTVAAGLESVGSVSSACAMRLLREVRRQQMDLSVGAHGHMAAMLADAIQREEELSTEMTGEGGTADGDPAVARAWSRVAATPSSGQCAGPSTAGPGTATHSELASESGGSDSDSDSDSATSNGAEKTAARQAKATLRAGHSRPTPAPGDALGTMFLKAPPTWAEGGLACLPSRIYADRGQCHCGAAVVQRDRAAFICTPHYIGMITLEATYCSKCQALRLPLADSSTRGLGIGHGITWAPALEVRSVHSRRQPPVHTRSQPRSHSATQPRQSRAATHSAHSHATACRSTQPRSQEHAATQPQPCRHAVAAGSPAQLQSRIPSALTWLRWGF